MRRDYLIAIILMVAAIPGGAALMAAPEYLHLTGTALAVTFWGGVLLTLLLLFLAIAIALRGEAESPPAGHRQRMLAIVGMTIFGLGFVACAVWFFAPNENTTKGTAKPASSPETNTQLSMPNGGGLLLEGANRNNFTGAWITGGATLKNSDDNQFPGAVIQDKLPTGQQNVTVPKPSGEFSQLTNAALLAKTLEFSRTIREFEENNRAKSSEVSDIAREKIIKLDQDTQRNEINEIHNKSRKDSEDLYNSYVQEYRSDYFATGRSLLSELAFRLGPKANIEASDPVQIADLQKAFGALNEGRLFGAWPVRSAANLLERLAKMLPKDQ